MPNFPSAQAMAQPVPEETDVAIVGGGLAGAALAYYLARAGTEVVLLERNDLNREASGTNAGSFHFQIALHQLTSWEAASDRDRLLGEVRLLVDGMRLWTALEAELGASLDLHTTGGLMVAETPVELQLLRDKQQIEADAGLETHLLVGDELRAFAPYLADDLAGAVWCPSEGHANPLLAAPLFALRAIEAGAQLRTHAAVRELHAHERPGAHRFTLVTDRGTVRAHRVVNAAGAWANDLAALSGLRFGLRADGLHVNVSEPRARLLEPMVQHIGRRLTLKQASNGTFIIGGGWPARPELAPRRYSTIWSSAAGNTAVAVRVMPQLADVQIVRTWSGVMAFTEDLAPIVGETAQLPGYHMLVATTGFTLGPLMARMLAERMSNSTALPAAFSPDRAIATVH
jgi:glycine/D-amino acid oxidase-like deaminating enzyme